MNPLFDSLTHAMQTSHIAACFFDALLKSFVVLVLAGSICALARRASATTRHLVWFLAVASLPCLPLLNLLLPAWEKPVWSVSTRFDSGNQISLALNFSPSANIETAAPETLATASAGKISGDSNRKISTHFNLNWLVFGLAAWAVGTASILISVAVGQFRLRKFSRAAQLLENADWRRLRNEVRETLRLRRSVNLLQSADNVMPLTWGWLRPVVLLPAAANDWPAERRRIVLLHELAHVKRWDCLTQLAAKIVCALYWFNPLVWLAARQMCVERERACDDLVLNGGCKASDYAGHLVDIAQSFRRVPTVAAIAMARPSGLAQRVEAILDGRRNRNRLAKLTVIFLAAAFLSLGWLIGSYAADNSGPPWTLKDSRVAESLKRFVAEKKAQEESLIKTDETDFAKEYAGDVAHLARPDCQPFFAAADHGDWQTVSNLSAELQQHTLGLSQATNGYPHGMWLQPVKETFGAIEAFATGNEKYSKTIGDEVIQSIPAGSVYFGGTDPGRFIITAMQKSHVNGEPFFTLTQNALADGTYLEYLRSMYNGKIYIPTPAEAQHCFEQYAADIQKRAQNNQLKPGENFKADNGRIQISGQTAVMSINGLLVKIIFDKNPGREFFIEESFPLDWMYPQLEPHGLIFKLNRQPLAELSAAMVQQDRAYWQKFVRGMIGGWLNDDTSVNEVSEFAEKVFLQHDLGGFTGDPRFVQNDYSSRIFSKLRTSLAGLYAWRAEHATDAADAARMAHAADFAFRQAVALCPASPETANRYADFLTKQHREAEAKLVQNLAEQFELRPANSSTPPAKTSFFQIRPVVEAPADDAEKMIMISTNHDTGQVRQEVCFVEKPVLLDQTTLQSAKLIAGPQGDRQIEITFTDAGQKQFAEVTREYLHQRLAIIIDGKLMEAPVVQSEISGGKCQIVGSFSEAEAKALAAEINAAVGK